MHSFRKFRTSAYSIPKPNSVSCTNVHAISLKQIRWIVKKFYSILMEFFYSCCVWTLGLYLNCKLHTVHSIRFLSMPSRFPFLLGSFIIIFSPSSFFVVGLFSVLHPRLPFGFFVYFSFICVLLKKISSALINAYFACFALVFNLEWIWCEILIQYSIVNFCAISLALIIDEYYVRCMSIR